MKTALLLLTALCSAFILAGQSFVPSGISNRTKDRISVVRKSGKIFIKTTNYHEWDGQAVLPLFNLDPDREYEFSCQVKAPEEKCFYIQAKLFRGKKSIRIESEENSSCDSRVSLRFNSGKFENIEISLRSRCLDNCVGKTFTISDFYFGTPQINAPRKSCRLEVIPQFHSAGIYLRNCSSSDPSKFKAKLSFKKQQDKDFQSVKLPISYDFNAREMRTSLLELDEDTVYDFCLQISDNGKNEELNGTFRTRSSNYPIAETIVVEKLPFKFKSGTAAGSIRYTTPPGTVLDGGNTSRCAINLDRLEYVILDNMEIKGGRIESISVKHANNIVIRNCNISNFGRVGIHRPDIDGRYYEKNYSINNDCGIRIFNSRRITVENSVIHSPRGNANSWFYFHPSGPNAIHIGDAQQTVLRGNDLFGSTFHRWNDAVESKGNGKLSGGVGSDAEIYGNYFAVCNDDGMELDGGQRNVRFACNKSEDTLCGVSAAPCLIGPSYIWNNLFCGKGDAYFYKASGIKNNYSVSGTGTIYLFNNTILDYNDGIGGFSIREDEKLKMKFPVFKVYGRRNLVRTNGPLVSKGVFKKEFLCDTAEDEKCGANAFIDEHSGNYRTKNNSAVGAVQNSINQLPRRNTKFDISKSKISFDCNDGKIRKQFLEISARENCEISVVQGADFFKVEPCKFSLKAGERKNIAVTVLPEKMQIPARFVSAVSVRQGNGKSRPVLIECITWNNLDMLKKFRSSLVSGKITKLAPKCIKVDFTLPESGNCYLFLRHKKLEKVSYAMFSIDNRKAERKMVRPPDGFENAWCIVSGLTYNGKANRPIQLAKGNHCVIIDGIDADCVTGFAATANPDTLRLAPGK